MFGLKDKLPPAHKPWELIRRAVADLNEEQLTPGVVIDMEEWHTASGGVCYECLAGAVMSRSLSASRGTSFSPSEFPRYSARLFALNKFRIGFVHKGLILLGFCTSSLEFVQETRGMSDYDRFPAKLETEMLDLADYLEVRLQGYWAIHTQFSNLLRRRHEGRVL